MSRLLFFPLVALATLCCGLPARADTFVVNFHELDGQPLRGKDGGHNSLLVYQELRGTQVDDTANRVVVDAPKTRVPIALTPTPVDMDDDGQITFTVALNPGLGDRTIVIVAQRFDEAFPSTALAFVVVSPDNTRNHILDIAVPKVSVSAPSYREPPASYRRHRCFLFRRRFQ